MKLIETIRNVLYNISKEVKILGLLTAEELQKHLNISRTTLWRLRKEGLPHKKIGHKTIRYDLEEVEKWLEEQNK